MNIVMRTEADDVFDATGIAARARRTGDAAPDVTLPDSTGQTVRLSDVWRRGPLVVVFYPRRLVQLLQPAAARMAAAGRRTARLGATLLAISPQTPDNSMDTAEKNTLAFTVLSDCALEAAHGFGLAYTLHPDVVDYYGSVGTDIPVLNGNGQWVLPVPATYVIDCAGDIRFLVDRGRRAQTRGAARGPSRHRGAGDAGLAATHAQSHPPTRAAQARGHRAAPATHSPIQRRAIMHLGKTYRVTEFIIWTRRQIYLLLAVGMLPVVLYQVLGLRWLTIPLTVVGLLGTATSFIVGFKNVQTYNRTVEAQHLWTAILGSSRFWGTSVRGFAPRPGDARELIERHVGVADLPALRAAHPEAVGDHGEGDQRGIP